MALITGISQGPYQLAFSCMCSNMSLLWKSSLSQMTFSSEPSRCHSSLQTERPDQLVWAPYPRRKKAILLWLSTQTLFHGAVIHNWIAGLNPNALRDGKENFWGRLSKQIYFFPEWIKEFLYWLADVHTHSFTYYSKYVMANGNKQSTSGLCSTTLTLIHEHGRYLWSSLPQKHLTDAFSI